MAYQEGENRRIIKGSVPGANYPRYANGEIINMLSNLSEVIGQFLSDDQVVFVVLTDKKNIYRMWYTIVKSKVVLSWDEDLCLSIYVWMKLLLFMFELLVLPIIRKLIHFHLYSFVLWYICHQSSLLYPLLYNHYKYGAYIIEREDITKHNSEYAYENIAAPLTNC